MAAVSMNDLRDQVNALIASIPDRGEVNGQIGKVDIALDNNGDVEGEALIFQTILLSKLQRYHQGESGLLTPPDETVNSRTLQLHDDLFQYAGLPQYIVGVPTGPEDAVGFFDKDNTGQTEIKSNGNRAQVTVYPGSFDDPAIVTVTIKKKGDVEFNMPLGFAIHEEIINVKATHKANKGAEGTGGVTISACLKYHPHDYADLGMFHQKADEEVAERLDAATGHSCDGAVLGSRPANASLFARGLDAAGSFLSSVFAPRPLYAVHAGLAGHSGGDAPLSPFAVGIQEYTAAVERIDSPNSYDSPTNTLSFRRQNFTFEFWLSVKLNGENYSCTTARVAHLKAIIHQSGKSAAAPVAAVACETVNNLSTFKVVLSNPDRPKVISGTISILVNDVKAKPTPTFNFKTF